MTRRKDPAKPPLPAPTATAHLPRFAPVPVKPRVDGWTPERQRAFIGALADSGCVHRAAAQVHMTPESAYWLRRRPGAEGFRKAWDDALSGGCIAPPDPLPLTQRGMMHALEAAARRRREAIEASGLTQAEIDEMNAAIIRDFTPAR